MIAAALFHRPDLWPALLAVPAVVGLLAFASARRRARLDALVSEERRAALCADLSRGRRRLRSACIAGALAAGTAALLDPVWGEELRVVEPRGVDVVVALDVSRSMLARDVPPSRLERARREIEALADRARGDRLGLVAFAGEARLAVPLTSDVDTFRGLAAAADVTSVRVGGSDLGAAVDRAAEALRGAKEASGDAASPPGTIVLMTDGEDLEGRGLAAAKRAAAGGVRIHCIGFGSTRGSKIAVGDDGGGGEAFLKGPEGNEVVSAMDVESLRKIASETGGEFLRADAVPLPALELYEKRIVPMAKKTFEAEARLTKKHRFQWPLLAALPLWLFFLATTDRGRARR